MANKVLIFAGAPDGKALDWTAAELLDDFQHHITQFTGQTDRTRPVLPTETTVSAEPSSAPDHALWRSVPLEKQHVPTGFSQLHDFGFELGPGALFISTASISFGTSTPGDSEEEPQAYGQLHRNGPSHVTSQFYEHSLAVHEDVTSSLLLPSQSEDATSFMTDEFAASISFQSRNGLAHVPSVKDPLPLPRGEINDLEDLPSAAYITKIHPQTMTRNLIVGIISISRPREVKTRWGGTRTLVEVLVGDETTAGFAVTFWLPPNTTVEESVLSGLRLRDVILVQNVALNAFMKKVYGSSLRKDLTRVHLLYRARLGPQDVSGYYSTSDLMVGGAAHPQLAKTRRVWDWVINFVGDGRPGRAADGKRSAAPDTARPCHWDRPPLDSQ